MEEQDRQQRQRRVKVIENTSHRTGERHATIKPHKRESEVSVKQLITDYLGGLKQGSLTQTLWGSVVAKNASVLQGNFGLAANDEPYLLLNVAGNGTAGMLLSSTGVHLADGRGGTAAVSWKDLPSTQIGYQRGMLVIGQSGISSRDGQTLATMLQQIQTKLGK